MSDDWNEMFSEEFDPTWPYNYKWAFDSQTGRADVWRVMGGLDGRPTHRREVENRWGRPPQIQSGDVMGLASYIPAEMKIDGTVVAPPEVHTQTYYNQPTPQEITQWFQRTYPHATVRDAVLRAPRLGKVAAPVKETLKWVWNDKNGLLLWAVGQDSLPTHDQKALAEWHRKTSPYSEGDTLGYAFPDPEKVEVETYNGSPIPPSATGPLRQQLAEWYPNQQIVFDHIGLIENGDSSFGSDPANYRSATLAWAHANLGSEEPHRKPLVSSERPSMTTERKSGLLARLFSKKVTAEADMEGCMVALYLDKKAAKKLKIKRGEPVENMHITLLYFSDKAADRDDWDKVQRLVEQIAKQSPPLSGTVSGYGVFNSDEGDVLWASPSVQGLAELRHKIYEACEDAGFHTDTEHDWVPHITLKYDHKGKLPKDSLELDFAELSFAQGDDQHHYEFKGNLEKTTMAERSGDPELDELIEEFMQGNFQGDWPASWDAMDDVAESSGFEFPGWNKPMPIENFKHPGVSEGQCYVLADELANFLSQRGLRAYTSDDVTIGSPHIENVERFPWKGDESSVEDFGLKRPSWAGKDEFVPHNWCIVEKDGHTYGIDFTASQFRESEFPLVQRLDDHGGWERKWGSLEKSAMPYDPQAWQEDKPPQLFHATTPELAESVLAEGLRPGQPHRQGELLSPRPDHVYLTEDPTFAHQDNRSVLLVVDPSKLDPSKLNPDEDQMREYNDPYDESWGSPWNPKARPDADLQPGEALGDYAERTGWGDDPAITQWAFKDSGNIAYRGAIPPEAIRRATPEEMASYGLKTSRADVWDDALSSEPEEYFPYKFLIGQDGRIVGGPAAAHETLHDWFDLTDFEEVARGEYNPGGSMTLATWQKTPWSPEETARRVHDWYATVDDPEYKFEPNGEVHHRGWIPQKGWDRSQFHLAMAFSPQMWQRILKQPLYHVTHREFLPLIMEQGLTASSERDEFRDDENTFFQPRPGHVYLWTDENQAYESGRWQDDSFNSERANDPVLLEIDPSQLDPSKFKADEDYAYNNDMADYGYPEAPRAQEPEWYQVDPVNQPGRVNLRYHEPEQSLGEWADQTGLDSPEITDDSALSEMSVAYEGVIPPGAITIARYRDEHTGSAAPEPPNYRKQEKPSEACGLCKMMSDGKCWGYGNKPVEPDMVCDSFSPETKKTEKRAMAEQWPTLEELKRPWADANGYEPLGSNGDWFMGGGCAHLALAMKSLWPEGKITAGWYDDHGRKALGHAAFYDPQTGHAWDGTGAHQYHDVAVSGHSGDIDSDVDPAELAEFMGINWAADNPWEDNGVYDGATFAQNHFMPDSYAEATADQCPKCQTPMKYEASSDGLVCPNCGYWPGDEEFGEDWHTSSHGKVADNDYLDWSGWEGAHRFVTDGKEILTDPETKPINDSQWRDSELEDKFRTIYPEAKSFVSGWVVPTADGMGLGIWAPAAGHGDKHEPGLHEIIGVVEKELGKPTHLITNEEHLSDEGMYDPGTETQWQTLSHKLTKPN